MRDFFISFNREDKDWAEWIAWTLEKAGHTVWFQRWDFLPGNRFMLRMDQAIRESRQTIAVLSETFLRSAFTQAEWSSVIADDPTGQHRKLLPVRVKECEPDGLLKGIVYTDLIDLSEPDARAALHAMLLQNGRPSHPPVFPGAPRDPVDAAQITTTAKPFPGPVVKENPSPPNLGRIVALSCNRTDQRDAFYEAFEANVQNWRTYPQVYVVHGRRKERHASLVARFQETTIQKYANFVKSKAPLEIWQCPWSYKIEVEQARQQLIELLIRRSHQDDPRFRFEKQEYSVTSFRSAIAPLGNSVVIVQHEIEAQRWVKTTGAVIKSYLKFWDEVKAGASHSNGHSEFAQFIVFLNVVYPAADTPGWKLWERLDLGDWVKKKRISAALKRIRKDRETETGSDEKASFCLYTLLQELPRVGLDDLIEWFEEHHLGRNEVAWEAQSKNIFRNKGWRFKDRRNMAEVETALDEFIEAMQISTAEMTR